MKIRILLLLLIFLFINSFSIADDEVSSSKSEWGKNVDVFNSGFENQEAVSDTKVKKIIEQIKERSLTKKQRKIRDEVNPLSPLSDFEHLKDFTQAQDPEDELSQTLTVMVPVHAYNAEGIQITPGYYKLSCHKIGENLYVLELSQGTKKILTVEAIPTTQDLEQETISFCNAEIIEGNRIRLMYGSLDLNLVGYLYFK